VNDRHFLNWLEMHSRVHFIAPLPSLVHGS
jgi:hypothetical protein